MGWIDVSSINTIMSVVGILIAMVSLINQYYIPDKLDLKLNLSNNNYEDAAMILNGQQMIVGPMARYFHVEVINKHNKKLAKNCKVYLVSLMEEGENKELLYQNQMLPLKWKGYPSFIIDIPPNGAQKFDAFYVIHNEPDRLLLNAFADFTKLIPNVKGNKKLRVKYRVTADNFKAKEKEFIITLSNQLSNVKIEAAN